MTRWKCCLGRLLDRWEDTNLFHGLKVGSFKAIFLSSLYLHILFPFTFPRSMRLSGLIFLVPATGNSFGPVIWNLHSVRLDTVPSDLFPPVTPPKSVSVRSLGISTVPWPPLLDDGDWLPLSPPKSVSVRSLGISTEYGSPQLLDILLQFHDGGSPPNLSTFSLAFTGPLPYFLYFFFTPFYRRSSPSTPFCYCRNLLIYP